MSASVLRRKVLEEINQMPEEKLGEVYEFIHFFRLGVETLKNSPEEIMQFAGCWQDMPDEEFEEFLAEIAERRHHAFSGRTARETIIS